MIINYDRNPRLTTDEKLQNLTENIQMAFIEADANHYSKRETDKMLKKIWEAIEEIRRSVT